MGCAALIGWMIVTGAVASPQVAFVCIELTGGWCESDGACHRNTLAPAEYRISAAQVPAHRANAPAVLRECRSGQCGSDWEVTLRALGNGSMSVSSEGEQFSISRTTGFFTRVSWSSGANLGRVSHTFGHCRILVSK